MPTVARDPSLPVGAFILALEVPEISLSLENQDSHPTSSPMYSRPPSLGQLFILNFHDLEATPAHDTTRKMHQWAFILRLLQSTIKSFLGFSGPSNVHSNSYEAAVISFEITTWTMLLPSLA